MPDPAGDSGRVIVIDDDSAVRDSIAFLLRSVQLPYRLYPDAQSFLNDFDPAEVACIVLDIRMPGMSGLTLQDELLARHAAQPIIFITGHGDIQMAVQAMRKGAADFIQKPFRDQDLLDCINGALESAKAVRKASDDQRRLGERYDQLTPREREVMEMVTGGCANKVIAHELAVSQRTVEIHRARVMEKMGARNLAQLVRIQLMLTGGPSRPGAAAPD